MLLPLVHCFHVELKKHLHWNCLGCLLHRFLTLTSGPSLSDPGKWRWQLGCPDASDSSEVLQVCAPCGALIAVGWPGSGRKCPQANWWQCQAVTTVEGQLCRGPPHRAGLASAGLWCPPSPPSECVALGGGWVVI